LTKISNKVVGKNSLKNEVANLVEAGFPQNLAERLFKPEEKTA